MQGASKRIKIYEDEREDKSTTKENVYLTFNCGYKIHPNIFINESKGIVSIATNIKCERCGCDVKSLNIGNHVIKNVLQVFSLTTFLSYLN